MFLTLSVLELGAQQADPTTIEELSAIESGNVFIINVNNMTEDCQEQLNAMASSYRNNDRSIMGDIGKSMLTGGVTAVVSVVGEELFKLTQVRSSQKKKWKEMRQRECVFVDSLESVTGQCDFYSKPSAYGPLDPSDMRFDGITFTSRRNGREVLRMVCRLDTSRLDQMFMHSKFHLILDSLTFHPYRSYLPNFSANNISAGSEAAAAEYFDEIKGFSYDELGNHMIKIDMDLTSSWINEQVQIYQNMRLGSFSLEIPVPKSALKDSVFYYSREEALAGDMKPIEIFGDSFVVPRSYMPGAADNPSWGTGEYKIKLTLTQRAKYNQDSERSKNWHKDYKNLVRMQNGGRGPNDYWMDIKTTFMDKSGVIMKATYMPLLNYGTKTINNQINSISIKGEPESPKK